MKKLLFLVGLIAGCVLPTTPQASANGTPCIVCDSQGCPRVVKCRFSGRECSFTSVTDPTVENGQTQAGQINGGPIGDLNQPTATVTLTCTIQVGAANSTHAGADAVALSGTGTGFASVAGQASYTSPEGQPVYLCTQATINGTTYYLDETNSEWTFNSSAGCGEAISQEILPGPLAPVFTIVDQLFVDVIDPTICPTLATLFPPEGDIPELGWDCPPYGG